MNNMTLIQGQVANIEIYQSDSSATIVTLWAKNDDTGSTWNASGTYSAGTATIAITGLDTANVGTYSYQINETVPEGYVKYGAGACDDCSYGKIYICATLDGGIS